MQHRVGSASGGQMLSPLGGNGGRIEFASQSTVDWACTGALWARSKARMATPAAPNHVFGFEIDRDGRYLCI